MEAGKGLVEIKVIDANDVVLQISDTDTIPQRHSPKVVLAELENLKSRAQLSSFTNSASPEISTSTPTSNKPPKIPTESLTRRRSLAKSAFSKPKSRFAEPHNPNDAKLADERTKLGKSSSPCRNSPNLASPNSKFNVGTQKGSMKSAPTTPKTPLIGSPRKDGDDDDEDEDEEVYTTANLKLGEHKGKKVKVLVIIEWILFVCLMGLLIASLTVNILKSCVIWSLELWKWCLMVSVVFCGRLFTGWFMNVLVFLIERNFLLRKKVLYFVYGMRRSFRVFIWLGVVLLAWVLLFRRGVERSEETSKILTFTTSALGSCLIGSAIWVVKNFLVKLLSTSFQCSRFFDRIQESIFHQYVLQTLSGPPLMEMAEQVGCANTGGQLSYRSKRKEGRVEQEEVIDVEKLKNLKQEKVSAWTMKGLINVISGSGLSTISNSLENYDDEEGEQKNEEIKSEWEATAAAYRIFRNVAKHGHKYIEEDDLLRFMRKEEVNHMLPLFEGAAESGKIKRSTFKNWLVRVYLERKSLAHSLNDTKTAIEELNRLVTGIVLILVVIVWLLMMGFLTTKVLVLISSQLLLAAFMFGNMAKTVFECIIFVFVMHPFDVGDRCVIDGVQMVVEEMNILTTIFLRYDNEKISYPNSVLATKPISNFNRSPEMSDSVEFAVDISTSMESIGALKSRIKAYLESKPQHWRPGHSVAVKEIENVNKMKMALYVTHTINFQNAGDRTSRRSDLVLELKKIFEDLCIKYHLLPQEVHLHYVESATSATPLPSR